MSFLLSHTSFGRGSWLSNYSHLLDTIIGHISWLERISLWFKRKLKIIVFYCSLLSFDRGSANSISCFVTFSDFSQLSPPKFVVIFIDKASSLNASKPQKTTTVNLVTKQDMASKEVSQCLTTSNRKGEHMSKAVNAMCKIYRSKYIGAKQWKIYRRRRGKNLQRRANPNIF